MQPLSLLRIPSAFVILAVNLIANTHCYADTPPTPEPKGDFCHPKQQYFLEWDSESMDVLNNFRFKMKAICPTAEFNFNSFNKNPNTLGRDIPTYLVGTPSWVKNKLITLNRKVEFPKALEDESTAMYGRPSTKMIVAISADKFAAGGKSTFSSFGSEASAIDYIGKDYCQVSPELKQLLDLQLPIAPDQKMQKAMLKGPIAMDMFSVQRLGAILLNLVIGQKVPGPPAKILQFYSLDFDQDDLSTGFKLSIVRNYPDNVTETKSLFIDSGIFTNNFPSPMTAMDIPLAEKCSIKKWMKETSELDQWHP